jgi:DNA replication protein DnaC
VLYRSAAKLFRDLAQARADGSLGGLLESIARTDVLLVDDFAMAPLSDDERRSFLEVCDDRYGRRWGLWNNWTESPVKDFESS